MALCKLSELGRAIPAEDVPAGLHEDIAWLSARFEEAKLDRTTTRHRLRKLVANNPELQGRFGGHRSEQCRDLFDAAGEHAQEEGEPRTGVQHFLTAIVVDASPMLKEAVRNAHGRWSMLRRAVGLRGSKEDGASGASFPARPGDRDPRRPRGEQRDKPAKRRKKSLLERLGRDLTALAREGKLTPCVGRKDEMRLMAQVLRRQSKNNPALVGDPGVGKTCIVEGLAQRVVLENAPDAIRNWRIIEISMSSLLAGSAFRGSVRGETPAADQGGLC